jgi:sugar O-acyltransferase (sialic acid O-acetyltransferase NeuD family)
MAKVIIFGNKDLAQLAHYYLSNDSDHKVVAFTVHQNYLENKNEYCGLPLLPFETIESAYPPENYVFLAPVTHRNMNKNRADIYFQIKAKGYKLISYISSKATIFEKLKIGENCFILENNTIQPFVSIGDNTILWSGNHIGHHSIIHDHVFISSQVVISGHCVVGEYSFIGVNATLRDNITIGNSSFIGMGAIINTDTEANSVYAGQLAKKINISSENLNS